MTLTILIQIDSYSNRSHSYLSLVHTKVFLYTFFLFHGVLQPIFKTWLTEYFGLRTDFKVRHKKEKNISFFSRPIASFCDLLKLAKYLFKNSAQDFFLFTQWRLPPLVGRRNPLCR